MSFKVREIRMRKRQIYMGIIDCLHLTEELRQTSTGFSII